MLGTQNTQARPPYFLYGAAAILSAVLLFILFCVLSPGSNIEDDPYSFVSIFFGLPCAFILGFIASLISTLREEKYWGVSVALLAIYSLPALGSAFLVLQVIVTAL